MVTSRAIYPGRIALVYQSSRHNPNRNKTTHNRAFRIQNLDTSLCTAPASPRITTARTLGLQTASIMPQPKALKQVKLKIKGT